jgi:hypothetical protein
MVVLKEEEVEGKRFNNHLFQVLIRTVIHI